MLSWLIAIIIGVLAGVITGLIPGIHVNLVTALLLSASTLLIGITTPETLVLFIIALAVTHTFLDVIPSIYLGAPESDMALGVLPGHRYLLKGWGYMAVKLTIIGSLGSLLLASLLVPILIFLIPHIYTFIQPFLGYLIALVVLFMLCREKKVGWAVLFFLLSGILGWFVLNGTLENPLYPLLTGLFGIATLLYSLNSSTEIPPQETSTKIKLQKSKVMKALSASTFAGFLTSLFPGLGAAQGAIIAMQLARNIGDHGFMVLIGGINTVNFVLSLVTFYTIDKARNGAVIAVQALVPSSLPLLAIGIAAALVAGSVACWLCLYIARGFSKVMGKVPYKMTVVSVILLLILVGFLLTGFTGLLILATSTALGLLPAIVKCSRTHAMGCLLLPVMLFFL